MSDKLASRVVSRWIESSIFELNDTVLYGKYKNKRGKIVAFGLDEKGNPTVDVEPIPKGRKKTFTMGLYKIWKAPEAK